MMQKRGGDGHMAWWRTKVIIEMFSIYLEECFLWEAILMYCLVEFGDIFHCDECCESCLWGSIFYCWHTCCYTELVDKPVNTPTNIFQMDASSECSRTLQLIKSSVPEISQSTKTWYLRRCVQHDSTAITVGLNIFHFISHEKGLGSAKMLCHSPLPHNGYTCIEIIIYSHNTFTHRHVQSPKRYRVARNHWYVTITWWKPNTIR